MVVLIFEMLFLGAVPSLMEGAGFACGVIGAVVIGMARKN
jgi:hypothetical protein